MRKSLINKSKFLSLVLRHKPEVIDLQLDNNGWASIYQIIHSAKIPITYEEIMEIVAQNNKKRFSLDHSKTMIRANQGHSIKVNLNLKEKIPPDILFHGTALKNFDIILKEGIIKGVRHHVHLSSDKETALSVGKRHGEPIVLQIDCKKMYEDGLKFFISENKIWLTEYIAPKYLI